MGINYRSIKEVPIHIRCCIQNQLGDISLWLVLVLVIERLRFVASCSITSPSLNSEMNPWNIVVFINAVEGICMPESISPV
jgi:hypothetical protein